MTSVRFHWQKTQAVLGKKALTFSVYGLRIAQVDEDMQGFAGVDTITRKFLITNVRREDNKTLFAVLQAVHRAGWVICAYVELLPCISRETVQNHVTHGVELTPKGKTSGERTLPPTPAPVVPRGETLGSHAQNRAEYPEKREGKDKARINMPEPSNERFLHALRATGFPAPSLILPGVLHRLLYYMSRQNVPSAWFGRNLHRCI